MANGRLLSWCCTRMTLPYAPTPSIFTKMKSAKLDLLAALGRFVPAHKPADDSRCDKRGGSCCCCCCCPVPISTTGAVMLGGGWSIFSVKNCRTNSWSRAWAGIASTARSHNNNILRRCRQRPQRHTDEKYAIKGKSAPMSVNRSERDVAAANGEQRDARRGSTAKVLAATSDCAM